ncbi:MAG: molybdopterin converting factor subunit 1 [Gammaproteobacteria bacterium]|nr:MAG: molybdopterin converting factor subunit 1 [Gammaproteobacteria bacterium]
MRELRLRYLASLREQLGTTEEALAIPAEGTTLEHVLEQLGSRHGATAVAALTAGNVRLALNQELVEAKGLIVRAGDELAFLPPVTGG